MTVVEDVLGITAKELYDDWVAYITERYESQYAAVKAEGEVMGDDKVVQQAPLQQPGRAGQVPCQAKVAAREGPREVRKVQVRASHIRGWLLVRVPRLCGCE